MVAALISHVILHQEPILHHVRKPDTNVSTVMEGDLLSAFFVADVGVGMAIAGIGGTAFTATELD